MSRSDRVATTDDHLEAVIEQLSGKSAWTGRAMAGEKPRSKYHREITKVAIVDGREVMVTVSIDVYDVLQAWRVTNPALSHLVKKCLQPGARGHKTLTQDLDDIVQSAIRARELEQ